MEKTKCELNSYSWTEIANIAESGNANKVFGIGDRKTIELYTGERIDAVIIGFGHDSISGSENKAGITFSLLNMLDGEFEMNEQWTNKGGWDRSKMRNVYMPRCFKLLPAELQNEIKSIDKNTSAGEGSSDLVISSDKLFLFSEKEIFNRADYSYAGEGKQYPYYKVEQNRVKQRSGSANYWWLRSPSSGNTNGFCVVYNSGSASSYYANSYHGVALGFCV